MSSRNSSHDSQDARSMGVDLSAEEILGTAKNRMVQTGPSPNPMKTLSKVDSRKRGNDMSCGATIRHRPSRGRVYECSTMDSRGKL